MFNTVAMSLSSQLSRTDFFIIVNFSFSLIVLINYVSITVRGQVIGADPDQTVLRRLKALISISK